MSRILLKTCLCSIALAPLLASGQAGTGNAYQGRQPQQSAQPVQQGQAGVPLAPGGATGPQGSHTPGMPAGAPPMPTPLPPRDLVQSSLDQTAPLTPDEIRRFLKELSARNQAGMENLTDRPPAKPVTSVEALDLSPGATPPVVRVAMGQGAVISFADAAGRPWPIADDLNFNASAFEVKLIGPHLYTIKLNRPGPANITVVLKDLPRPVVITALPATDEADYLKEFTIPRFLGNQPPPTVAASVTSGALALNAPELLNYLYRTPPKEAKTLGVVGMPGVMAWQNSSTTMVVRTAGLLVIPAWKRRHSSTDGVAVYEVPLSPVVTIAQDGLQHRVAVNGFVVTSSKTN
jgi:intracellular multiplication protein IcmK